MDISIRLLDGSVKEGINGLYESCRIGKGVVVVVRATEVVISPVMYNVLNHRSYWSIGLEHPKRLLL